MAAAADPTVAAVGPRVKALREAMDLSLRDLAERSGVSAPMLSQVERGETSPTLQVASRIASGLELRLSQLLRLDEESAVSIVRRGDGRRGGAGGHAYELLTPPLPGLRAEVTRHRLAPDAVTGGPGDPPRHEAGGRETASRSTPTCRTTSPTTDPRRQSCWPSCRPACAAHDFNPLRQDLGRA